MVEIIKGTRGVDVIVTVPPFRNRSEIDILEDALREIKMELRRREKK